MNRVLGNLLLLATSLAVSILIAEFGARMALDPVDFLNPTLKNDDMLQYRIDGRTGGHDAWCFRNVRVPARGENVYNMGLGGYGPIQYLHLMRVLAAKLNPELVVAGLYFGNDFFDVYNLVRINKNWREYGSVGGSEAEESLLVTTRHSRSFMHGLRDWLSRNSVLYAAPTQLPLFDFVRARETATRVAGDKNNLVAYRDAKHNMLFDVSPQSRFLDMNDPRFKAAMEITKRVIINLQHERQRLGIRVVVVLIPTKERVYANLLKQAGHVGRNLRLADALRHEDAARDAIVGLLREQDIESVDLLPALEAGVIQRDLYPLTDPHLNKTGYRVIAEAIDLYLGRPR
jgi:hypothetical protein